MHLFSKQTVLSPVSFRWIESVAISVFCFLLFFVTLRLLDTGIPSELCGEYLQACAIGKLGFVQLFAFGGTTALGIFIFAKTTSPFRALHLSPVSFYQLCGCLILGIGLQLTLAEFSNWIHEIWPLSEAQRLQIYQWVHHEDPIVFAAAIFALVFAAPISEELFFRGLHFWQLRRCYSPVFAIGFSSILFGLAHGEVSAILYAFVAGMVLGWVAFHTQSTLASVLVHISTNATPLLLSEKMIPIEGFNTLSPPQTHMPLFYSVTGIFLTLAGLLWIVKSSPHDQKASG